MNHIVSNPEVLGGKPVIAGTRISVEFVLELFASGLSEREILEDYPHLSVEGLRACLAYAAQSFQNEVYLELDPAS